MFQRTFFDAEFTADQRLKRMESAPDEERAQALGMPRVDRNDLAALSASCRAVIRVLADGKWHGSADLIQRTGYTEAMRRLRELRAAGFQIEMRGVGRAVEYRLVK